MKTAIDIHNYPRLLEMEQRTLDRSELSKRNKYLIVEFKDNLVRDNISIARIVRYVGVLRILALMIKTDYDEMTKKDAENYIRNQLKHHNVKIIDDRQQRLSAFTAE